VPATSALPAKADTSIDGRDVRTGFPPHMITLHRKPRVLGNRTRERFGQVNRRASTVTASDGSGVWVLRGARGGVDDRRLGALVERSSTTSPMRASEACMQRSLSAARKGTQVNDFSDLSQPSKLMTAVRFRSPAPVLPFVRTGTLDNFFLAAGLQ